MSKFKVGDTVKLKSGGPCMTITNLKTGDRPLYHTAGALISAHCTWFDRNEARGEWFPVEALRG